MTDPVDYLAHDVEDAERTVQLARDRLRAIQRSFMSRSTGAADVHAAEVALSRALDALDYTRQIQRNARLNGAA